jgi:hypothetical protein
MGQVEKLLRVICGVFYLIISVLSCAPTKGNMDGAAYLCGAIVYFTSDGSADGPIPQTIEKWIMQAKHTRKLELIRYH